MNANTVQKRANPMFDSFDYAPMHPYHHRCESQTRLSVRFGLWEPLGSTPPCVPVVTTVQLRDATNRVVAEGMPISRYNSKMSEQLVGHRFNLPAGFEGGWIYFTTVFVLTQVQNVPDAVTAYLKRCSFTYGFVGKRGKTTTIECAAQPHFEGTQAVFVVKQAFAVTMPSR